MELTAQFNQNDWIRLKLADYDIKQMRDQIIDGINKDFILKDETFWNRLIFQISNQISNKILNEVDAKINNINQSFIIASKQNIEVITESIKVDSIIDAEEYVRNKYQKTGCSVFKASELNYTKTPHIALNQILNEARTGIPDFAVFTNYTFIFVEVKTNGDSLRVSQMKWIKEHPNIKVIIYYLEQILNGATNANTED